MLLASTTICRTRILHSRRILGHRYFLDRTSMILLFGVLTVAKTQFGRAFAIYFRGFFERLPLLAGETHSGIERRMKSSNIGTVNAVSPCWGLKTMPFLIRTVRRGAAAVTFIANMRAMSPERCGPGPSSAIARM